VEKKPKLDPKVFLGLMMGGGSLAAGAIKLHLFDGGVDWLFWTLAAVFIVGTGVAIWYIGMRRFHAETRTFIDRPARKSSPRHDEPPI
jgi:drug/metabolite transporter (DMT)-like permease